ncbi:hypothetical protein [Cohnella sp. JJ-181]|uniref:hypothetical protein n=1 Tax=Cohnella rhizoplanae TaxID=2974897 RepID=UPI0022FFBAD0|nr:hypothetical protein [Cohnella sp. JJ-181]CAI6043081.1 hypothetical protein COHCIP112018_01165 [Cohnella sp. JJ-181]
MEELLAVQALRSKSRAKAGRTGRPVRRKRAGVVRRKPGMRKRATAGSKRRVGRVRSRKRGTADRGVSFNQAYNEGYNAGFAKGFEDGHQLAYDQQV